MSASSSASILNLLIEEPVLLKSLMARLGTAGVTGTTTIDIKKNGSSLFSSGAAISFASGATVPTYPGTYSTNPPSFVKGDLVQVYVTAVQSGTAPIDLAGGLLFTRTKGEPPAAVLTDTLDPDSGN